MTIQSMHDFQPCMALAIGPPPPFSCVPAFFEAGFAFLSCFMSFKAPKQHIKIKLCAAAASTTDASQLGTIQIPDGPWIDELPTSWRSHMNAQLRALGCKDSFRMRGGARGGLWAAFTASKTLPLDQGSVSGIMQHVSDESVRRQVRQLPFCCHHNVVDVVSGMEAAVSLERDLLLSPHTLHFF